VLRPQVREQATDGDRFDLGGEELRDQVADGRRVEGDEHCALGADALGQLETPGAAPGAAGGAAPRATSSGRFCRPISSTSAKPAVVISAVAAPRRSSRALVAIVEPWTT
jgi:hypothetical protein